MSRPRILLTRKLPTDVEARAARDYEADVNPDDYLYTHDELLAHTIGKDGLLVTVTDRIDAKLIAALPESIRVIATFSVGYDHIDIAAAAARNIVVTNTPDVLTDATAEIAMLLILGAARGAPAGAAAIRDGQWKSWAPTGMLGREITGKRLGILGLGRIGQAVAHRARAFGMTVHYHNRSRLNADVEGGAIFHADAASLFRVSDI
ncbi:MAG: NAD(P)-dependent oxidoreductase, partial [Parvibaculum sp.]